MSPVLQVDFFALRTELPDACKRIRAQPRRALFSVAFAVRATQLRKAIHLQV